MNYKEINENMNNVENIKQQILNDELYTDEEIIKIVEEYNKDKSRFSIKRLNTKQVVKGYHRMVKRAEKIIAKENKREEKKREKEQKEAEKELEELLKVTGLTMEEYEDLTPMERAQLNIQLKQAKNIKNMTAMQAMNNIAGGMDRL